MPARDDRIDAYIAKSAEFAKPILAHLRALVHEACPGVEETIKWGMPHFTRNGRILAGMSAFKQHAAFAVPMAAAAGGSAGKRGEAMGDYGRITALSDLPSRRALIAQLQRAARAIDAGEKRPRGRRDIPKPPVEIPEALTLALSKNAAARSHFAGFAPSKRRDYAEWIAEAKQEQTRARRIAQAMEWIADGKSRNWKYEKPSG
ncbi:YdeI/OmpD-associated family protein [Luteimonas aquatica]|uniref:YdeI/OmpD-associated family protein n=1 Tax=Luteimonas aquatica TaxID=450364 RepID=UPI001F55BBBE|nr:YdeI/OmpD-associated family protein [Luteimonas aquatica]